MIKNLLLSTLISVGVGSSAISIDKSDVVRPTTPPESANFLLVDTVFPDNTISFDGAVLTFNGSLNFTQLQSLPSDFVFDFVFIGDYIFNDFPFYDIEFHYNYLNEGPGYEIEPTLSDELPFFPASFVYEGTLPVTMRRSYLEDMIDLYGVVDVTVNIAFDKIIPPSLHRAYSDYFRSNVGYGNVRSLNNWVNQVIDGYYEDGYSQGTATASGGWLGNMIFGTIGGMVGFLFAVSNFEVLGVSIMSIITLFVAISMVMLLLKAFK